MTPPWIGVDPGARYTGVVVRRGNDLLDHRTYTRVSTGELPDRAYLRRIVLDLMDLVELHGAGVAVEGVQKPSPFMGKTGNVSFSNVTGILGTAAVWGAVVAVLPAQIVPPGKNGSAPMRAYPVELRPTSGRGAGKDKLRHERSAWDVAGAASAAARLAAISA